jgi:hypothetical protein
MSLGDAQNVQFPPFRGLEDFCLDSARFQLPSFNDQSRWSNRVVNNLLYYQTNYLTLMITMIILDGMLFHSEFLYGLIGTTCAVMSVLTATAENGSLSELRTSHPWAMLVGWVFSGYVVVKRLRDIAVFAFPLAMSLLLIFSHASLRTRNIKNRLANKMEQLGVMRTPMGLLFELAAVACPTEENSTKKNKPDTFATSRSSEKSSFPACEVWPAPRLQKHTI